MSAAPARLDVAGQLPNIPPLQVTVAFEWWKELSSGQQKLLAPKEGKHVDIGDGLHTLDRTVASDGARAGARAMGKPTNEGNQRSLELPAYDAVRALIEEVVGVERRVEPEVTEMNVRLNGLDLLAETNSESDGSVHRDGDPDHIGPFDSASVKVLHREVTTLHLETRSEQMRSGLSERQWLMT